MQTKTLNKMEFHFDEATHTYSQGGITLPGVTSILSDVFPTQAARFYTEESRIRGQMVHLTCELYDRKTLDEDTLDDRLRPYLDGWKRFLKETDLIMLDAETRGVSKWGYAGTDERFGGTRDRLAIDKKGKKVLIDIKSSIAKPAWIGLQLGFYEVLANEGGHTVHERMSVHLPGDGRFIINHWPDSKNDALAVWRVHQLRRKMGIDI